MERSIVDRTTEKLAIAKELNLPEQAQLLENYQALAALATLPIKPITKRAIERILYRGLWRNPRSRGAVIWDMLGKGVLFGGGVSACVSLVGLVVFAICTDTAPQDLTWTNYLPVWISIALGSLVGMAITVTTSGMDITYNSMPLCVWDSPIPYGGLLAVQEAKQLGFEDFFVYYPERLANHDPMIVARRCGKLWQVFAWHDGDIRG